jgi:hypothetical protein
MIALIVTMMSITWSALRNGAYATDQWFILENGRWILTHGFPSTNPWTIHGGSVIIEQWLSAVISYGAYHLAGQFGLACIHGLQLSILILIMYRIVIIVNHQISIPTIIGISASYVILMMITSMRPSIWSIITAMLSILIVVSWREGHHNHYAIMLLSVTVLAGNLHMAMAILTVAIPIGYMIIDVIVHRQASIWSAKGICLLGCIQIISLIINPYGWRGFIFVFQSYGVAAYRNVIREMRPISSLASMDIVLLMGIIAIMMLALIISYRSSSLWWSTLLFSILVIIGTCWSIRNYLLIVIPMLLASVLFEQRYGHRLPHDHRSLNITIALSVSVMMIILTLGMQQSSYTEQPVINHRLANIVMNQPGPVASTEDYGNMIIWMGLKTAIDARPELSSNTITHNGHRDWMDYADALLDGGSTSSRYIASLQHDVRWYLYPIGSNLDTACAQNLNLQPVGTGSGYRLYENRLVK